MRLRLLTRIYSAIEYVRDGIAALLARDTGPNYACDVRMVVPGRDQDWTGRMYDHDGVIAKPCYGLDQLIPASPEREIVPVSARNMSVKINGGENPLTLRCHPRRCSLRRCRR